MDSIQAITPSFTKGAQETDIQGSDSSNFEKYVIDTHSEFDLSEIPNTSVVLGGQYNSASVFQEKFNIQSISNPRLVISTAGIDLSTGLILAHKRHMLTLSGYVATGISNMDSGFWDEVSSDWEIKDLVFSHDGIQNSGVVNSRNENKDEFGDYPDWIYRLRNKLKQEICLIPVGPNDVETLFPGRLEQIHELREEKKRTQENYKEKLGNILKLKGLIDDTEIVAKLVNLQSTHRVSDRDFEIIDDAYKIQKLAWGNICEKHALEDLTIVIDSLNGVVRFLKSNNKHLSILPEENLKRLEKELGAISSGDRPTTSQINYLFGMHKQLSDFYNQLNLERLSWGRNQAITSDSVRTAAKPAYHALIYISQYLHNLYGANWPFVLDVGANLSNFYRVTRDLYGEEPASNIVEIESSPEVYKSARSINPNGVLADISDLIKDGTSKGLPVICESSDAVRELCETPHNFGVILASFVLEHLDANQVRDTLVAFDSLLVNPPKGEENLAKYPTLIIASPENSHVPVHLPKVLEEVGGYKVIVQDYIINHLTKEARERIRLHEGEEVLGAIEALTQRPFHLLICARVDNLDEEKLANIPDQKLRTKKGSFRKNNGDGSTEKDIQELSPERLYALDIIPNLQASDFEIKASQVISRTQITEDPKHKDFEHKVACLVYFKEFLNKEDKIKLQIFLNLWDEEEKDFLSQSLFSFINETPNTVEIKYKKLPDHLQREIDKEHKLILDAVERAKTETRVDEDRIQRGVNAKRKELQNKSYTLWEVYEMECKYRGKTGPKSIFWKTRLTTPGKRVRALRENKVWIARELAERMAEAATRKGKECDVKKLTHRIQCWESQGNTPNKEDLKLLVEVFNIASIDIDPLYKEELPTEEIIARFTDDTSPGDRVRALRENKRWGAPKLAREMAEVALRNGQKCDVEKLADRIQGWELQGNTPKSKDLELLEGVFGVPEIVIVPEHFRKR